MTTAARDCERFLGDSVNREASASGHSSGNAKIAKFKSIALLVIAALLASAPVAICADYVARFYVEVPWEDEITYFVTLKGFMEGSISFQRVLLMQVLEHRVGLLLVTLYTIGRAFSFQSLPWMVENIVVLTFTASLVFLRARGYVEPKLKGIFWLIPLSWLFLSLRQSEMLVWGYCIDLAINLLLVVTVFLVLERSTRLGLSFGSACLAGIASSFFNAAGMLVWPIGFVQIVLAHLSSSGSSKGTAIAKLITWSAIAAGVIAVIVGTGSSHGRSIPNFATLRQNGLDILLLWLTCLGNPLACEPKTALAAGLGLLGMFGFCALKYAIGSDDTRKTCIVPLSFCLYWLMTAALITMGRFGAGLEVACLSRYSTNLVLGIVGLYLFCLTLKKSGAVRSHLAAAMMLAMIVPSLITSAQYAEVQGDELHNLRVVVANRVENHRLESEAELQRTYINQTAFVPSVLPFLEEKKFGLFALQHAPTKLTKPAQGPATPNYLLETINTEQVHKYPLQQAAVVSKSDRVVDFRGYSIDFTSRMPCEKLYVCIDKKLEIPATMGIFRRDIAHRYHRNSYLASGFVASCDPKLIEKGVHQVSLKMKYAGQDQAIDSGHLASLRVD